MFVRHALICAAFTVSCTGGSGSGEGTVDAAPAIDAGPPPPYVLTCDSLTCPDGIMINDRSCLWECLDYGGEQVRYEVLFTDGDDGCWVPEVSIREPICPG